MPLSSAFLRLGASVLPVDLLCEHPLNLLEDCVYEQLLAVAFSGQVFLAHAAPSCKEYSRLKLRPGGPSALRTPEFLNGVPGLSPQQQDTVRFSRELFVRCITVLYAAFVSGAHVSLEQPPNAMSWLEPEASFFLSAIEADCNVMPACAFDWDIAKRWTFSSSLRAHQALASSCPHGMHTHVSIAGVRDELGGFVSQQSAEYPAALSDPSTTLSGDCLASH